MISKFVARRVVGPLHHRFLAGRRAEILADRLLRFIPENTPLRGVDVGCGTGELASIVRSKRPEISLVGVDPHLRAKTHIDVTQADGADLPFSDNEFDFSLLIDTLHHSDDMRAVLEEASRVTKGFVLLKDHFEENLLDTAVLRFMDWVANRPYGVNLPYNYVNEAKWQELFASLGLAQTEILRSLQMYPWPASYLCDGHLHFIGRLETTG